MTVDCRVGPTQLSELADDSSKNTRLAVLEGTFLPGKGMSKHVTAACVLKDFNSV